ncbi:MAG: EutN/CcmL family microcompartment protein [Chloroflexota bacterium]
MILAQVIGNVVATRKEDGLVGFKLLLVQAIEPATDARSGHQFIAVDTLGAGITDRVLVVSGTGARIISEMHRNAPIDAAIVGIVDTVDVMA